MDPQICPGRNLPVAFRITLWLSIPAFLSGALKAETCLVLSPPAMAADGSATMDLSLFSRSGDAPAALQWTLAYSASTLTGINVDSAPLLVTSGKSAICGGQPGSYTCLAMGANAATIPSGVIAKVTATLPPGAGLPGIRIKDVLAVSAAGNFIPVFSRATPPGAASECRPHPPLNQSGVR